MMHRMTGIGERCGCDSCATGRARQLGWTPPPQPRPVERVVYDATSFDDIYLAGVQVHVERTDDHNWYALIWDDRGRQVLLYMRDASIAHAEGVDDITSGPASSAEGSGSN